MAATGIATGDSSTKKIYDEMLFKTSYKNSYWMGNFGAGDMTGPLVAKTKEFVKTACKDFKCENSKIFLLGFSQGAMLIHGLILSKSLKLNGAACLSGRMVPYLFDPKRDWTGL